MENLVPDNKHILNTTNAVEEILQSIKHVINQVKDENTDIFLRYMSFCKLRAFIHSQEMFLKMHQFGILSGHAINHEILQTEEAKEMGWDKIKVENHPFFENEEKDEESEELDRKIFSEILRAALKGMD